MEARAAGVDEALLPNECGFITEGSTSNIFFASSSSGLVTPPLDSGVLPGITRQVVLELAANLGTKTVEEEIRVEDLNHFDEAFLTNSLMEITPLVALEDGAGRSTSIGSGVPGQLTRKLTAAYRELVERETAMQ